MQSDVHAQLIAGVEAYRMPERAKSLIAHSHLQLLSGVTAAGKNTIIQHLVDNDNYEFVVSHTTRQPRYNQGELEKNGKVYWFIDETEMLSMVKSGAFVEDKMVHGTFYGTSMAAIEHATRAGRRPVKEPDVQGALEYIQAVPHIRPLFVLPPSYKVWQERLSKRGEMTAEDYERRLLSAHKELKIAIDTPQFALIVNHEFHKTVDEIMHGVDVSDKTQAERRLLAQRLIDDLAARSN